MKARDVMTANPSVVTPDDSILKASEVMRDRNLGVVFVIEDLRTRRLVGVLTDRDIVSRCVASGHGTSCTVQAHMTSSHLTTAEIDADVEEVAAKMERDRVRRIPVLGELGRLAGVISLSDLATRLRPSNPQLVERVAGRVSEEAVATV